MISLPVDVSPVNAILSMPGCSTIICPTVDPGPVIDVEHAGRKADLLRDLGERQRGQRRLARRLDDDRVAARQRRRDLPRRQQQRKVPRHDRRDDADRLAQRVGEVVALRPESSRRGSCRPSRRSTGSTRRPPGPRSAATRRSACRCGASRAARSRRRCSISCSPIFQTSRPRSRADSLPHGPSSAARAAATAASTSRLLGRGDFGDHLLGRRIDDVDRLAARPRRAIRR